MKEQDPIKLLAIKDRVYDLLVTNGNLRNSDRKLVVEIWKQEVTHHRGMGMVGFFNAYERWELTPADTITRCRRKLQETIPALRGTMWNKRHDLQEEAINQLKAF
tara:strand:+ start:433 stop:747 length:315 start_codon:yes stop_codon:yes gene_type:complete